MLLLCSKSGAVDETEIGSFIIDHRPDFSSEEWAESVWFENSFSKTVDCITSDYEDVVSLKYSKFQSLMSFKKANSNHLIHVVSKRKRPNNTEGLNKVELKANGLDSEILSLMHEYTVLTV